MARPMDNMTFQASFHQQNGPYPFLSHPQIQPHPYNFEYMTSICHIDPAIMTKTLNVTVTKSPTPCR